MSTVATSTLLGRPLWYELMTTDPKAAETFYDRVVGWTSMLFPPSPEPYTVFNREGGTPVAGVMATPDGLKAPPFWAMYVGVVKLEETAAKIKRLGGSECSPVIGDVPTVGRMQMMKDPQGAAFYIYEPSSAEHQPEADAVVGDASWHELMTSDAPAAMKFYSDVFGWQPSESLDMGEMGRSHMFNRPHGERPRRHDEPVSRNGTRTAQLAGLLPRARHHRGRRAHQVERWIDPQRADGGSRR